MKPRSSQATRRPSRLGIFLLRGAVVAVGILALATGGSAFIRLTNGGQGLRHTVQPITYTIHPSGSQDVPGDSTEFAAIRLSFDTWSHVDGASLSFRESTIPDNSPKVHANDRVNMVLFDETNSTGLFSGANYVIAITPVFYDAAGGIFDADIVFNGRDHTFGTDLASGKYDIQNIATHEIGHFIGLDHTGVAGATLIPFAFPQETRLRSLAPDDLAGAVTIYPGPASAQRCSVAGQVLHDATGRGIDGAHVVAVNAITGETEAGAITSSTGNFTIEMLRAGTYRVYAEPLDGPCMGVNIQRGTVETGFATSFYGGVASPLSVVLSPGQRGVQLGQLRLKDLAADFNLQGATPRQVLRGTTARIDLTGSGVMAGEEFSVTGGGIRISGETVLGPGSSFTCSVDANATPGLRDIYVFRGYGAQREMVALPGGFEIIAAAPVLSTVSPLQGLASGGQIVTLRGSSFVDGARVLFGDQVSPLVSFVSTAELQVAAPANQVGTVAVTAINPDGQQSRLGGAYAYLGMPSLASVSPADGPSAGGVAVTLFGEQFSSRDQVLFDQRSAASIVVSDQGRRLDCTTPPGEAGTAVDVTVIDQGGSSTLAAAYRYIEPRIDSFDPPVGSTSGGTVVQILGDGFGPGARVDFGSRSAVSVVFVSQREIRATSPAGSVGTVALTVVTSDGHADVAPSGYRYLDGVEPRITAVSPSRGYTSGGLSVRIYGSNFVSPVVLFGSAAATNVTLVSPGEIWVTTPRVSAAGATDVVVRNPDGLQAKAFGAFTYDQPTGGAVLSSSGSGGGGGGGCAAAAAGRGAGEGAGALLPLLTLLGALGIMRRRARAARALVRR